MEEFNNHTIFTKIITEFEETRDNFIYKTILPYCEECGNRIIYNLKRERKEE